MNILYQAHVVVLVWFMAIAQAKFEPDRACTKEEKIQYKTALAETDGYSECLEEQKKKNVEFDPKQLHEYGRTKTSAASCKINDCSEAYAELLASGKVPNCQVWMGNIRLNLLEMLYGLNQLCSGTIKFLPPTSGQRTVELLTGQINPQIYSDAFLVKDMSELDLVNFNSKFKAAGQAAHYPAGIPHTTPLAHEVHRTLFDREMNPNPHHAHGQPSVFHRAHPDPAHRHLAREARARQSFGSGVDLHPQIKRAHQNVLDLHEIHFGDHHEHEHPEDHDPDADDWLELRDELDAEEAYWQNMRFD